MTKFVVIGIFIYLMFVAWQVSQLAVKVQHIDEYLIQQATDDTSSTQPHTDGHL